MKKNYSISFSSFIFDYRDNPMFLILMEVMIMLSIAVADNASTKLEGQFTISAWVFIEGANRATDNLQ